jgi:hypothetical protein
MSHTAYPGQPLLTCRQVALDLAVVGLLRVAVDRQLHILICQLPIVSAELQEIGSLDTFAELQQRVLIFGDALHVVLTREKEILDIVVALHGSTLTMVELVVPVHFSRGRVIEVVSTCQDQIWGYQKSSAHSKLTFSRIAGEVKCSDVLVHWFLHIFRGISERLYSERFLAVVCFFSLDDRVGLSYLLLASWQTPTPTPHC